MAEGQRPDAARRSRGRFHPSSWKNGRQRVQPHRGGCRSGYDGRAAGSVSSSRLASYSSISVFSASASAEICSLGLHRHHLQLIGGSHSLEYPCSSRERAGGEVVGDGGGGWILGVWILTERSGRDPEQR